LSLKCQSNYEYQLFNPLILKEKYGTRTDAWFTKQAIDSAKGYYFCTTMGKVIHSDDGEEDNLFAGFCSNISPALAANARAKGEIIEEDYDGNLDDIDVDNAKEPPIKLDMHIMFSKSALGEGGGYDDAQSVGTIMTGTSRATALLGQIGGALTATEDELSTMTSSDTPTGTTTNTAAIAASTRQAGVHDDNQ
jgi:hypothetical protein